MKCLLRATPLIEAIATSIVIDGVGWGLFIGSPDRQNPNRLFEVEDSKKPLIKKVWEMWETSILLGILRIRKCGKCGNCGKCGKCNIPTDASGFKQNQLQISKINVWAMTYTLRLAALSEGRSIFDRGEKRSSHRRTYYMDVVSIVNFFCLNSELIVLHLGMNRQAPVRRARAGDLAMVQLWVFPADIGM